MGKSKAAQRLLEEIGEPPNELKPNEVIVSVVKLRGNNIYEVVVPASESQRLKLDNEELLASMPPKFRNTVFVRRGGYVVITLHEDPSNDIKVKGEISNVVMNVKDWIKYPYWPKEFLKEEEKTRDKMMFPSDEEDDYDEPIGEALEEEGETLEEP